MANLVGTLARRGVEAVHKHHSQDGGQLTHIKLSTPAVVLLGATFVAFIVLASSIEYTIRILMGHLAMVESPETTVVQVYTPASSTDSEKKELEADSLLEVELESTTVTSLKPLTASIRRTKRHLASIGGRTARWRGLGVFIVYSIVTTVVSGLLRGTLMRGIPLGGVVANLAAALMASRLHCAFTHKIITMPSSKRLYERKVSRSQWKQLLAPTAFSILARDLSCVTIVSTFRACNMLAGQIIQSGKTPQWVAPIVALVPGIFASVFLGIFVMLPAYAALVRKEASLLPEEDETIVSFDRTFGGKLTHLSDTLSYADAWKSFAGEARRRVIKLYAKFFFIMVALTFVMAHVFALELLVVARDQVHEAAEVARQHLKARGF